MCWFEGAGPWCHDYKSNPHSCDWTHVLLVNRCQIWANIPFSAQAVQKQDPLFIYNRLKCHQSPQQESVEGVNLPTITHIAWALARTCSYGIYGHLELLTQGSRALTVYRMSSPSPGCHRLSLEGILWAFSLVRPCPLPKKSPERLSSLPLLVGPTMSPQSRANSADLAKAP